MYTEENERGRFPLRDILLKAIVVIIFLILTIFIITKVTSPKTLKTSSSAYDKVFSENLKKMEEAALLYYKKDKLPKVVGEESKVTLREMVNSNLLEAFTDASGKACDVTESYIRLTKNEEDYTLRVNLKCVEKEDYSLMKVGEYEYCKYDICKKDNSKIKAKDKDKENKEVKEKVEVTEQKDEKENKVNSNTNQNSIKPNNNNSNSSGNNQKVLMYEYKKVTNPVFSAWSSWSSWQYNNERYSAIKCNDNDINCLKEIQLFSRIEKVGTEDGKDVYGRVHYYSYRTRNIISNGNISIKWSTYNDTNLLNQGYGYTGNYK